MNTETILPYHWLKTYPKDLVQLDFVPLLGSPPAFNWEVFSTYFAKSLGLSSLKIEPKETCFRNQEESLQGMGDDPSILELALAPLTGKAYWIFPKQALKALFAMTAGSEEELFPDAEKEWEKEFYHFAASEAILAFSKTGFDPSLLPQILEESSPPETACFCIDIELETDDSKLLGRLAFTPDLVEAFRNKFKATTLHYPSGTTEAALVTLQVVGGKSSLTRKEWESINIGDLLLPDSLTLSFEEGKSRVALWFDGKPLFRARPKGQELKILEYPLLSEVTNPMAKKDEFEEEDEEFETIEESTFEEQPTEEEDLTEFEETEAETETETETEAEAEEKENEAEESSKVEPPVKSEAAKPSSSKPEEIPMVVAIEAARIRMTLKQLMELAPGNVIDLEIAPERGVDLTVNGCCIGRGELLKVGDTLGVRILEKA